MDFSSSRGKSLLWARRLGFDPGFGGMESFFSFHVQTGPGVHTAFCKMSTVGKEGRT